MVWKNKKNKYLGMKNTNHQGYLMKIIQYNTYDDIMVEFEEPYKCIVRSRTGTFINGGITNPYAPTICGVGIVGNKYPTTQDKNGNHCREYQTWSNMIKRCYDEKTREKNRTYEDVECDSRWFYYETFYEWIHSQINYDNVRKDPKYAIDKDILYKGNKIYAPEKCCLVPQRVNNLLLKSNAIRGDLPIGVFYHKVNGTYIAQCGGHGNNRYLGSFSTPEEAFYAYKKDKEREIKEVAIKEYSKGTITKKCYDALINYEVEITD